MQNNKSVDLSVVGDLGSIDVKDLITELIRKWYVIVFFLTVSLGIAYYNHKRATRVYNFSSTLLVIPKRTGSKVASIDEVLDESFTATSNRNVNDEIGLIKSVDNIAATIRKLHFQFEFYNDDDFKQDAYINPLLGFAFDSIAVDSPFSDFQVTFLSNQEYKITELKKKKSFPYNLIGGNDNSKVFSKTLRYGQIDASLGWSFILPNSSKELIGKSYYLSVSDVTDMAHALQSAVDVKPSVKEANLLAIDISGAHAPKMIDFLNTIVQEYMKGDLEEKNRQGRLTLNFLEKQIADAQRDMNLAESVLEQYKSNKRLPNIEMTTNILGRNLNDLELQRENTEIRLQQYQTVYNSLISENSQVSVPSNSNMGRQEDIMYNLISNLTMKIRERELLKNITSDNNIQARQLDIEIENIKKSIKEYTSNSITSTKVVLSRINNDITKIQDKLTNIPYEYHQLEDLTTEYNFQKNQLQKLAEKREDATMRLATNMSDCRVVDVARLSSKVPESPNAKLIYMIGLVLGGLPPVFIILLIRLIKDKVNRENDITRNTHISVIASIPQVKAKDSKKADKLASRSLLSESFNLLTMEIKQMLGVGNPYVIGITSMVGREGKTFCATNLAISFAGYQHKTLLIYFDLYKDETFIFEGISNQLGIADYLRHKAPMLSLIQPSGIKGLDIITKGSNAGNPLQLLQTSNIAEMFAELKGLYDVIIIDTPPVGIISDYLVLEPFTDITLNIVKYNTTPVPFLNRLNQMADKKLIRRPFIIFNGVNSNMMPEMKFIKSNKYLLHYYKEN